MTVSSTVARNDYTGNGSTSVYSYTFRIFFSSDLTVVKTDTGGNETTLLLNVDYTVSGVGAVNGGTVTLLAGNLPTDYQLSIKRIRPLTQDTDIRNQGEFLPEIHEDTFDHLVMIAQQLDDRLDRAVQVRDSVDPVSDFDPRLPADIVAAADKVPLTNTTGRGWANASTWPTGADIAQAEGFAEAAAASAAAASTSVGTNMPYGLNNVGFLASVAGNNLTVAIKQSDGTTDPSTGAATAYAYFRSATATTGGYIQRTRTSALSVVAPNGATLGHNNNQADYVYVYLLDNAGTVELALSGSNHWDEGQLQTTTTIDTASDNATTLYSTTGRSNVAIRLIGRTLSTQATAGAWASAMTRSETRNFFKEADEIVFSRSASFNAKHGITYLIDTSAARTIQLPTPRSGFKFKVKDSTGQASTTNTITLLRAAAEQIEAVATNFVYSTAFGSFEVWSDGTNWFVTDYINASLIDAMDLINVSLNATVAGNALTVAIKQADGSADPTVASPSIISFHSSTAGTGSVIRRKITAALSLTVPTGATLGFSSAYPGFIYVWALDNSGTVELALSSSWAHTEFSNTTFATLLDTSADDSGTMYSNPARAGNFPRRLIGVVTIAQATPGTWASSPSFVSTWPNVQRGLRIISLSAGVSTLNAHHGVTYLKPADGTAYSLQLPIPQTGFWFEVKRSTGGAGDNITIVRNSTEEIDYTAANYSLSTSREAARFVCNGSNWFRFYFN